MERFENAALDSSTPSEPQFDCLANSLIQLLETAKQDLEGDRQTAKALLAKASSILQSEVDRRSGANGSGTGGLAGWQIARVRAFIDRNLHVTIHTSDLSAVARRSPAHFARSFKHSFGESPHAYVMRRRLEKACHLMMTSSESLSQIALSVGFSDQSHLCKRFKEALGKSPSNWRRERELFDSPSSLEPARTVGYGNGSREINGSKVPPSDLSIDSGLARNCAKNVPVRNLFHRQRIELVEPGDGVFHERNRNIRWSSTISDTHKIRSR